MPEERFVDLIKKVLDKSLVDKKLSHRTELFVLSLKSLLPGEDEEAIKINYDRYDKEFALWKYYRETSNEVLDNILFAFQGEIYWKGLDDSLIYRLMPLIFTNPIYENLYGELVRNIVYTSGNLTSLIENILLAQLFYLVLNKYDGVTEKLKDQVINMEQKRFVEDFGRDFRLPLDSYDGIFQIDFEKAKILGLNVLNGIDSPKMKSLTRVYQTYLRNQDKASDEILSLLIEDLDDEVYYKTDVGYFNELGSYLYKIRKSRIDPKLLLIEDYSLPDVFGYKKGECFYHSLLNRCEVLDRQLDQDLLYVKLKTKSGIYNFRKPIRR